MFSTVQAMMGGGAGGMPSEATIFGKLDEIKGAFPCCSASAAMSHCGVTAVTSSSRWGAGIVDAVQSRIHNPDETTFVCVCIPEVGLKPCM